MASTILSHFSFLRLAIMKSVNTSAFCAILNAATVATPPAPIINTFPIVVVMIVFLLSFVCVQQLFSSSALMPRAFMSEYPSISWRKFPPAMGSMANTVMRFSSSAWRRALRTLS